MAEEEDELEKLLLDVRKTISDNKLFLERLVDETADVNSMEQTDVLAAEEDFEEL